MTHIKHKQQIEYIKSNMPPPPLDSSHVMKNLTFFSDPFGYISLGMNKKVLFTRAGSPFVHSLDQNNNLTFSRADLISEYLDCDDKI